MKHQKRSRTETNNDASQSNEEAKTGLAVEGTAGSTSGSCSTPQRESERETPSLTIEGVSLLNNNTGASSSRSMLFPRHRELDRDLLDIVARVMVQEQQGQPVSPERSPSGIAGPPEQKKPRTDAQMPVDVSSSSATHHHFDPSELIVLNAMKTDTDEPPSPLG